MRVRPIFAWYDIWVGVFVDRKKRRVYVFPAPVLGLVVDWSNHAESSRRSGKLTRELDETRLFESWYHPADSTL